MATGVEERYVSPVLVARFYAHAQANDESLRWLQKAADAKDTWLPHTALASDLQEVRKDPKYEELMRRINRPSGR